MQANHIYELATSLRAYVISRGCLVFGVCYDNWWKIQTHRVKGALNFGSSLDKNDAVLSVQLIYPETLWKNIACLSHLGNHEEINCGVRKE